MIQNSKYVVKRHLNGKDSILGHFEVKDGKVKFASEMDSLNIDQFPEGTMSKHTSDRIEYLMSNPDKDVYIEKV